MKTPDLRHTRIGWVGVMCGKCGHEDLYPVEPADPKDEFEKLLTNYLRLPTGLRQQAISLVEELAQLAEDVSVGTDLEARK